jgi:hypothetical protein
MKVTIESIISIEKDGGIIPARVWEGETDSGIKVICLMTRIAAKADQDLSQFERELQEQKPPSLDGLFWPSRMIL